MIKLNRDHVYEIRCDECGLILEKSQSDKSSEKKKLIMKHRYKAAILVYTGSYFDSYQFQEDLCPECKKKREAELTDIKAEIDRLSLGKNDDFYIAQVEKYGFFKIDDHVKVEV